MWRKSYLRIRFLIHKYFNRKLFTLTMWITFFCLYNVDNFFTPIPPVWGLPSRIPLPGPPYHTPERGVKHLNELFLKKISGVLFFPNIDPFLDPNGFSKKFLGVFFFQNIGLLNDILNYRVYDRYLMQWKLSYLNYH